MELNGLAAVVTGGASGLGAATAQALAKAGCQVALLDRDLSAAQVIADDIGALAIACDIADESATEAAFATASSTHGPTRILINCAGIVDAKRIVGREGPMPLDAFKTVIDVNLNGTFNCMRLAAAQMSQAAPLDSDDARGIIINTASIAAFDGQLGQAAYSASKGGVVSLTLPAARELAAFGIRVMCIAPGIIGTPMMLGLPDAVQDELVQQSLFPKRLGKPAEFAQLALSIIQNPMLNGEVIRFDAGMRMPAPHSSK